MASLATLPLVYLTPSTANNRETRAHHIRVDAAAELRGVARHFLKVDLRSKV